jgi:hypothetical protein
LSGHEGNRTHDGRGGNQEIPGMNMFNGPQDMNNNGGPVFVEAHKPKVLQKNAMIKKPGRHNKFLSQNE